MGNPHSNSGRSHPLPWVAMLFASLLVVATIQAGGASAPLVETAGSALASASSYFDEHAYLEPGVALASRRSGENLESLQIAYEREREARGDPEVLPGTMRRQQEQLDERDRVASQALAELPSRRLGVNPSSWRPLDLLTYVFLHSSVWHLAGNVLLLLLLGVYLEPALGALRAVFVFTCGTVGAGFGYALLLPTIDHVLIGSSGLLAGLLVVFAWNLRESRSEGFYALAVVGGMLWLAMPAWLGVPWSLTHPGIDLLGAQPDSQLVYWSYPGGVFGTVLAQMFSSLLSGRARERATLTHSARKSTGSVRLDDALRARAAGREEAAFQQLTVLLHQEPEQLDAALLLSDVARSLGRHDKSDEAMLRAIRIEAKREETTSAVRHWLDLTQKEIPRSADPALLIRIASLLRQQDHPRTSAVALREALDRASGSNTAPVAARVARAAQELDPKIAHDAAWRALGCRDLSLEERQNLEDLLAVVIPKLPGGEVNLARAWERDGAGPETLDCETRTRVLDVVRAVPYELDEEGMHIATSGGNKKRVLYERVEAVSVAAVAGLAEKPVLVVDLVLNWRDTQDDRLRVIRLRGDKFDPRGVVPADSPLDSFRRLVGTVLERSDALSLPDRDSALGNPFASFDELAIYERTVLMAEAPLSENDS